MSRFTLHHGDSREVLKGLADASVDSVVCDPPYELGFMGKGWDQTGIANDVSLWREVLRVLKPGGHLLAFSGTRTYHRMACAIEDAGFEIRDQIGWAYGSGFPKSLDVSKAIDKAAGAERDVVGFDSSRARPNRVGKVLGEVEYDRSDNGATITAPATDAAKQWQGWGTALKPAWEPIVMARKPLRGTVAANVLAHGTGALNIDGCRVMHDEECRLMAPSLANIERPSEKHRQAGRREETLELKPEGRWPANLIHDGSPEVVALFPYTESNSGDPFTRNSDKFRNAYGAFAGAAAESGYYGDAGSAARFFYCAKAGQEDRNEGCNGLPERTGGMVSNTSGQHITRRDGGAPGPRANHHPTVKPTALMAYLCRLVTPKGGTVLDPFMGSGATGKAAMLEGFNFIGIDLTAEYVEIARARIDFALRRGHQPSLLEATCTPF